MSEDIIQTMFHHSHNADGSARVDNCCGCWNVIQDETGLFLRCNECGEKRDLMPFVDPEGVALAYGVADFGEVKKMTSRDFCYWLQGLFELAKSEALDAEQTELVKRHLAMVFVHEIDPSHGDAKTQNILSNLHAKPLSFQDATIGARIDTPTGPVLYRC